MSHSWLCSYTRVAYAAGIAFHVLSAICDRAIVPWGCGGGMCVRQAAPVTEQLSHVYSIYTGTHTVTEGQTATKN